jgi:hypothetical protein
MTNREAIGPQLEDAARLEFNLSDKQALSGLAWSDCVFAGLYAGPHTWTWAMPVVAEDADDE